MFVPRYRFPAPHAIVSLLKHFPHTFALFTLSSTHTKITFHIPLHAHIHHFNTLGKSKKKRQKERQLKKFMRKG